MEVEVHRIHLLPLLLLLGLVFCAWTAPDTPPGEPDLKETIRINVTELKQNEKVQKQVVLNLTFFHGNTYVNDFPVKNGVTRMTFDTLILGNGTQTQRGIVSVRILVHNWPLTTGSDSALIIIEEEVTEIDGNEAQQAETMVLEILVNGGLMLLRQSLYTVPLTESMLHSIPRDDDVLFTLPNQPEEGRDQGPLQTTSQYLSRLVQTTVDEESEPGKLPETPLRAEPPDSYKVMCKWMEDLRKELSQFWLEAFPVLFSFMQVVVVGIAGAAIILGILKLCMPSCEHKGILSDQDLSALPVVAIPLLLEIPEKFDDDLMMEDNLICTKQ